MNYLDFLSTLPALLAVVGFVLFTLLQGRILKDDVSSDIVRKLRNQGRLDIDKYASVTPAKLRAILDVDRSLRSGIDQADFELLKQSLRQQFHIRLAVYVVLVILFMFGVATYTYQSSRPKPLRLSGIRLESTVPAAKGIAVDTDPLRISWTSDGPREDVRASLENARTHKRLRRSKFRRPRTRSRSREAPINRCFQLEHRTGSITFGR